MYQMQRARMIGILANSQDKKVHRGQEKKAGTEASRFPY